MPKHDRARNRVIADLVSLGPVVDDSGRATAVLRARVGYQRSDVGFIQLISAMERDGQIIREIRGKRTYSISLGPKAAISEEKAEIVERKPRGDDTGGTGETQSNFTVDRRPEDAILLTETDEELFNGDEAQFDYERLAAALLFKATRLLRREPDLRNEIAWMQKIEEADAANAGLQRDLAQARADVEEVKKERDELREQFELATRNLEILSERAPSKPRQRQSRRLQNDMTTEDRAILEVLRRSTPPLRATS